MLKVCIVIFLVTLALIDIVGIIGPSIKKAIEESKSKKKRKSFAKKK